MSKSCNLHSVNNDLITIIQRNFKRIIHLVSWALKRATSESFWIACLRKILPRYYNRHHPHVFFLIVIISQKRKAWWGLPEPNHFLRNTEDSQHNDSVLILLTMSHERCLPSVKHGVNIRLFPQITLSFVVRPVGRWTVLNGFSPLNYLRSEGEHDFSFGTIVLLYRRGMSDKHYIHGWLYRVFFEAR